MLGRTRSQLEGHAIVEVTHPDDLAKTTQAVRRRDGTGGLEKRYLHASGRPVWAALSYTVLDDPQLGGRYFLTHVEDITTRKESERALLEALERQQRGRRLLRAADLVRRDVISTVSHELRTPLTSIRGYVELLAEDSHLTEEERRMVDVVDRNTARLERLVEDLLLLGQVDRSAPPLVSEIRLDTLVVAAVDALEPQLAAHRLRLERVGLDTPCTVRAAGTSSTGRSPTCSPTPSSTPRRRHGLGDLVDHGRSGRADDRRHRRRHPGVRAAAALRPLYRGAAAVEIGAPGTGLGLAIVKGLVELNGGTVDVRWPSVTAPSSPSSSPPLHRLGPDRRKQPMSLILVVEDDDDIRDYLVLRLQRLGHDLVAAADGRSASSCPSAAVPTSSSPTGPCPG